MKNMMKNIDPRLLLGLGAGVVLICIVLGIAAWTAVNNPAFASYLGNAPAVSAQDENHWAQVEISKPLANAFDISAFAPQTIDTPVPAIEPSLV
ncbi:MAG TPA: hypothetical protein VJ987_05550, partial [Anaerolineales bacterium]|nr:hypothetical protein [Anaerolineales bacterium]